MIFFSIRSLQPSPLPADPGKISTIRGSHRRKFSQPHRSALGSEETQLSGSRKIRFHSAKSSSRSKRSNPVQQSGSRKNQFDPGHQRGSREGWFHSDKHSSRKKQFESFKQLESGKIQFDPDQQSGPGKQGSVSDRKEHQVNPGRIRFGKSGSK